MNTRIASAENEVEEEGEEEQEQEGGYDFFHFIKITEYTYRGYIFSNDQSYFLKYEVSMNNEYIVIQ